MFEVLGVFFNDPRQFGYLSLSSSLAVCGSFLIYTYWVIFQGRQAPNPETAALIESVAMAKEIAI